MNIVSTFKFILLLLYSLAVCLFYQSDVIGNEGIRFLLSLFLPITIVMLSLVIYKRTIKISLSFLTTLFVLDILYHLIQVRLGGFGFWPAISTISELDFIEDIGFILILVLVTVIYYTLSVIQLLPIIFKKKFFIPRRILVVCFIVSLIFALLLPFAVYYFHYQFGFKDTLSYFRHTLNFFNCTIEIRIKPENIRIYAENFLIALTLNHEHFLTPKIETKITSKVKELIQLLSRYRKVLIPLTLTLFTLIFFLFIFEGERKYNLQIPKEFNGNIPLALGDSFEKISKYTHLQRYTYFDGLSNKEKYYDTYHSNRASFNFDNWNKLKDVSLDITNDDSLSQIEFYKKNFHILKKYYGNNFKIYRDKRDLSKLIFVWNVNKEYLVFLVGLDKKSENPLDNHTHLVAYFNQYFYLEDHVITTNETLQSLGFE
jgi:hypothetical protein